MKKAFALAVLLVLVAGTALAWGPHGAGMHQWATDGAFEGSYGDFLEYRESVGWNIMPWIDSEEDFEFMRERHEAMEQNRGYGRFGGCPMWG